MARGQAAEAKGDATEKSSQNGTQTRKEARDDKIHQAAWLPSFKAKE
jgi:hypothetical protein